MWFYLRRGRRNLRHVPGQTRTFPRPLIHTPVRKFYDLLCLHLEIIIFVFYNNFHRNTSTFKRNYTQVEHKSKT